MNAHIRSDPHVVARLRKWSGICATLVIAAGCIGLSVWGLDGALLKYAAAWGVDMTADVALVSILGSGTLLLIKYAAQWGFIRNTGKILALAVIAIGVVTLAQYALGANVGIEGLLFPQGAGMAGRSDRHMTVSAALDVSMFGTAFLLLNAQLRGVSISQLLVLPAILLALVSINMSLYAAGAHGDQLQPPLMRLDAAVAFLLLCIGILFAYPDRGPMARLAGRNAQGFILRRLIPMQLVLVMAVGWLTAAGHQASLFSSELGTSLAVAGFAALMALATWWSAKWLARADAHRRDADEALRDLNAQPGSRVAERTKQLEAELENEIRHRAAAEEALKRSEANYRFLFECNPLPHGRPHSLTRALDVSERRRAEDAQRDYAARLRALSYQLLHVQEAERARIAAELHDEMGQRMTALKLGLQSMRGAVRSTNSEAKLDDCIQLAAGVLDRIRDLSLDLRPPLLGEIGLAGALDAHINNLADMSGLEIRLDAGRLQRLPPQIEIACFRVAQEALTNAIRHAEATRISVRLFLEQGRLQLRVADNGVGFDWDEAYRRALAGKSMGLLNMVERVKLIGGSCAISSAAGQGTAVEAFFPPDEGAREPFNPAAPSRPAPN
jgi:signal transduction histidine kinase/low affinity Fe/Cu permease